MDYEIPVQDTAGKSGRAGARSAAADLPSQRSGDSAGSGVAGPYPHVGVVPAGHGAGEASAVPKGAVVAKVARRVSGVAEAILGTAPVGARVLLRECGRGGRRDDPEIHREPEVGR